MKRRRRKKKSLNGISGMLFLLIFAAFCVFFLIMIGTMDMTILKEKVLSKETKEASSEEETSRPTLSFRDDNNVSYRIHTLKAEEIEEIAASFDQTPHGFGTDLHPAVDANNRPTQVNDLLYFYKDSGADVKAYCAEVGQKKCAITFQCATDFGHTGRVLDILKEKGVTSAFHVTRSFVEENPELTKRIINEGHEIGNHSYAAPDEGIACRPLDEQMQDAMLLQNHMLENFGYEMKKYNYNSGTWSIASGVMMTKMGYEVWFCSANYEDYIAGKEYDAEYTLSELKKMLHDGCVYCFHTTNKVTAEILPGLIDYIRNSGYEIISLP